MENGGKKKSNNTVSPALKQEFRNLGALIEDNRHKIEAVAEQFIDVNRKLDSHTDMIGGLAVKMTNVEAKMDNFEMKMVVLQEDIEFIKSGLKRKVDQEEFDALIRRVSVLERRVLK